MGLSVGFIKGGLWLMCWLGAALATLYGYPFLRPAASAFLMNRNIISNELLADVAIGAGMFIVSLIFLFTVSSMVTGWVRASRLNALDRSLGFLAGVAAAVIIVAAAYIPIAATWDKPEEQPDWLRQAKLRPVIEWASGIVESMLPREVTANLPGRAAGARQMPANVDDKNIEALAMPHLPQSKPDGAASYSTQERGDMDRLLQNSGR